MFALASFLGLLDDLGLVLAALIVSRLRLLVESLNGLLGEGVGLAGFRAGDDDGGARLVMFGLFDGAFAARVSFFLRFVLGGRIVSRLVLDDAHSAHFDGGGVTGLQLGISLSGFHL